MDVTLAVDLGGILLTDPTLGSFWSEAAQKDHFREAALRDLWFSELRLPLELGLIPESTVWDALSEVSSMRARDLRMLFLEEFVPINEGIEALGSCFEAGLPIVLATNHYAPWLDIWRSKYEWFSMFEAIACSSSMGSRKPDRAYLTELRNMCKHYASSVVLVDDDVDNILAAQELGISGIAGDASGSWGASVTSMNGTQWT